MPSDFRRLAAYRLAGELANDAHQVVVEWPSFDRWSVGIQLVRAIDSVGANIAEAAGRWSVADRRRVLYCARGSLLEAEHWLLVAAQRGLMPPFTGRIEEIARALNGLIKQPTSR